jgi:hypothetical protein
MMDKVKVYEINKGERDVRIGTCETTKCLSQDKRWLHYRQLPAICESLCQRIGQTVEIGTRQQFEAEIEDEKKPLFQRIDNQSKRIEELDLLCEEKDARIVKLERQLAERPTHDELVGRERQVQEYMLKIAELHEQLADQSAVESQQHDHIRKLEMENQELIDCLGAVTVQRDEAEKQLANKGNEPRRVVVAKGVLNSVGDIDYDGGGTRFELDYETCKRTKDFAGHRASLTMEILDKPEPTLAECWNLIRNVSGDNPSQEEIAAQQRCDKAVASEQDLYPIWEQWEAEDDKHDLPPYVFAALDTFFKEYSQC